MNKAEQNHKANKTRDIYSCINNPRGNYKKKERFLRHEDGCLITTDDEIA